MRALLERYQEKRHTVWRSHHAFSADTATYTYTSFVLMLKSHLNTTIRANLILADFVIRTIG